MSAQLLFYERATPISASRHRDWAVKVGGDYGFASHTNAVPVMAVEIPSAVLEYPVVFAGEHEAMVPVAILGIERDRNLFVSAASQWQGRYIPAFVRRYPFVFASRDEGKTLTLCIDEAFGGCNQEGKGQRLFDDSGERTDYLDKVLDFLQEYQKEFQRTKAFCRLLREHGLLEPMGAQIKLRSGRQLSLTGFQTVSRKKLDALEPDTLAILAKSGALELIYLHLLSMRNFTGMMERAADPLAGAAGGKGNGGSPPTETEGEAVVEETGQF
jgi:hypothetical protein